jgi:hypothetical protein
VRLILKLIVEGLLRVRLYVLGFLFLFFGALACNEKRFRTPPEYLGAIHSGQVRFKDSSVPHNFVRRDIATLYFAPMKEGHQAKCIERCIADADVTSTWRTPSQQAVPLDGYLYAATQYVHEQQPDAHRFAICCWPVVYDTNHALSTFSFLITEERLIYVKDLGPLTGPVRCPEDPKSEGWVTLDDYERGKIHRSPVPIQKSSP